MFTWRNRSLTAAFGPPNEGSGDEIRLRTFLYLGVYQVLYRNALEKGVQTRYDKKIGRAYV